MRQFTTLDAVAAPLPLDNVDTDKIIPAAYLKTVSRSGLGRALFAGLRYGDDGSERTDFVLNCEPWRRAGVLIAGANFGCGSSREHAPWALVDFGITCIVAESFADIFYGNCFKNGILPILLAEKERCELLRLAGDPGTARLRVDLEMQAIVTTDGRVLAFEIDPGRKAALIEGRDEIADTLAQDDVISAWEERRTVASPTVRTALSVLSNTPSRMPGTYFRDGID